MEKLRIEIRSQNRHLDARFKMAGVYRVETVLKISADLLSREEMKLQTPLKKEGHHFNTLKSPKGDSPSLFTPVHSGRAARPRPVTPERRKHAESLNVCAVFKREPACGGTRRRHSVMR